MKEWKKFIIMFVIGALLVMFGYAQGSQHAEFERDIYINRLYDKDAIINVWEERATNNLKLIQNYCDELKATYTHVVFNMNDCDIYTTSNGTNVICEKDKSLFVQSTLRK